MEDAFFERNRVDALAMERLTASPYVINIYGFCAMTVVQEFAGRQIHEKPMNPNESLDVAIQVATGIRDIHYIDNADQPVLVHNDINLANILMTDTGRPILNDFNVAILLMQRDNNDDKNTSYSSYSMQSSSSSSSLLTNESEVETCPFYSRFPNPQWRSPEEQVESEEESKYNPPIVDYKIDIYAMGNVLYRLLAGGSPWKRKGAIKLSPEEKLHVASAKRYNGTLPDLPNTTNLEEPANQILHEAMQMCYRFHPDDRPTAKELLHFLVSAKESRLVG
jgi:serine/threonine protein kinase